MSNILSTKGPPLDLITRPRTPDYSTTGIGDSAGGIVSPFQNNPGIYSGGSYYDGNYFGAYPYQEHPAPPDEEGSDNIGCTAYLYGEPPESDPFNQDAGQTIQLGSVFDRAWQFIKDQCQSAVSKLWPALEAANVVAPFIPEFSVILSALIMAGATAFVFETAPGLSPPLLSTEENNVSPDSPANQGGGGKVKVTEKQRLLVDNVVPLLGIKKQRILFGEDGVLFIFGKVGKRLETEVRYGSAEGDGLLIFVFPGKEGDEDALKELENSNFNLEPIKDIPAFKDIDINLFKAKGKPLPIDGDELRSPDSQGAPTPTDVAKRAQLKESAPVTSDEKSILFNAIVDAMKKSDLVIEDIVKGLDPSSDKHGFLMTGTLSRRDDKDDKDDKHDDFIYLPTGEVFTYMREYFSGAINVYYKDELLDVYLDTDNTSVQQVMIGNLHNYLEPLKKLPGSIPGVKKIRVHVRFGKATRSVGWLNPRFQKSAEVSTESKEAEQRQIADAVISHFGIGDPEVKPYGEGGLWISGTVKEPEKEDLGKIGAIYKKDGTLTVSIRFEGETPPANPEGIENLDDLRKMGQLFKEVKVDVNAKVLPHWINTDFPPVPEEYESLVNQLIGFCSEVNALLFDSEWLDLIKRYPEKGIGTLAVKLFNATESIGIKKKIAHIFAERLIKLKAMLESEKQKLLMSYIYSNEELKEMILGEYRPLDYKEYFENIEDREKKSRLAEILVDVFGLWDKTPAGVTGDKIKPGFIDLLSFQFLQTTPGPPWTAQKTVRDLADLVGPKNRGIFLWQLLNEIDLVSAGKTLSKKLEDLPLSPKKWRHFVELCEELGVPPAVFKQADKYTVRDLIDQMDDIEEKSQPSKPPVDTSVDDILKDLPPPSPKAVGGIDERFSKVAEDAGLLENEPEKDAEPKAAKKNPKPPHMGATFGRGEYAEKLQETLKKYWSDWYKEEIAPLPHPGERKREIGAALGLIKVRAEAIAREVIKNSGWNIEGSDAASLGLDRAVQLYLLRKGPEILKALRNNKLQKIASEIMPEKPASLAGMQDAFRNSIANIKMVAFLAGKGNPPDPNICMKNVINTALTLIGAAELPDVFSRFWQGLAVTALDKTNGVNMDIKKAFDFIEKHYGIKLHRYLDIAGSDPLPERALAILEGLPQELKDVMGSQSGLNLDGIKEKPAWIRWAYLKAYISGGIIYLNQRVNQDMGITAAIGDAEADLTTVVDKIEAKIREAKSHFEQMLIKFGGSREDQGILWRLLSSDQRQVFINLLKKLDQMEMRAGGEPTYMDIWKPVIEDEMKEREMRDPASGERIKIKKNGADNDSTRFQIDKLDKLFGGIISPNGKEAQTAAQGLLKQFNEAIKGQRLEFLDSLSGWVKRGTMKSSRIYLNMIIGRAKELTDDKTVAVRWSGYEIIKIKTLAGELSSDKGMSEEIVIKPAHSSEGIPRNILKAASRAGLDKNSLEFMIKEFAPYDRDYTLVDGFLYSNADRLKKSSGECKLKGDDFAAKLNKWVKDLKKKAGAVAENVNQDMAKVLRIIVGIEDADQMTEEKLIKLIQNSFTASIGVTMQPEVVSRQEEKLEEAKMPPDEAKQLVAGMPKMSEEQADRLIEDIVKTFKTIETTKYIEYGEKKSMGRIFEGAAKLVNRVSRGGHGQKLLDALSQNFGMSKIKKETFIQKVLERARYWTDGKIVFHQKWDNDDFTLEKLEVHTSTGGVAAKSGKGAGPRPPHMGATFGRGEYADELKRVFKKHWGEWYDKEVKPVKDRVEKRKKIGAVLGILKAEADIITYDIATSPAFANIDMDINVIGLDRAIHLHLIRKGPSILETLRESDSDKKILNDIMPTMPPNHELDKWFKSWLANIKTVSLLKGEISGKIQDDIFKNALRIALALELAKNLPGGFLGFWHRLSFKSIEDVKGAFDKIKADYSIDIHPFLKLAEQDPGPKKIMDILAESSELKLTLAALNNRPFQTIEDQPAALQWARLRDFIFERVTSFNEFLYKEELPATEPKPKTASTFNKVEFVFEELLRIFGRSEERKRLLWSLLSPGQQDIFKLLLPKLDSAKKTPYESIWEPITGKMPPLVPGTRSAVGAASVRRYPVGAASVRRLSRRGRRSYHRQKGLHE